MNMLFPQNFCVFYGSETFKTLFSMSLKKKHKIRKQWWHFFFRLVIWPAVPSNLSYGKLLNTQYLNFHTSAHSKASKSGKNKILRKENDLRFVLDIFISATWLASIIQNKNNQKDQLLLFWSGNYTIPQVKSETWLTNLFSKFSHKSKINVRRISNRSQISANFRFIFR